MKRNLIIAIVTGALVLLASCSAAKENAAPSPTTNTVAASSTDPDVEQELIKLDKEWSDVYKKADPRNQAILERVLANEYVYVEHDGRITNKEQDMAFVKTMGPASESEPANSDYKVRVYGDTAVMTHQSVDTRKEADGKEHRTRTFALHVFVKRDGRWQIVAAQRTRLPEQEPK